jgi:hypothetical protein
MTITTMTKPRGAILAAVVALIFGGMTLFSGGSVLFIDGPARVAAGHYVPFVLWFNFVAGFAYISAGVGLFLWRDWAVSLAMLIAVATLLVFAGLGLHIWLGGDYEQRTLAAMTLRSTVWLVIAFTTRAVWKKWTGK